MGVLFDYTQAEEAEPEMRCLGAVSEIKWLLIHMEAWTNSLMQGLLRTVCVRLTFAQSYTTLIYTVGAFFFFFFPSLSLFFFLCMCVCALLNCVPYLTSAGGRVTLFYLPNHSATVSLLDFGFRCSLVTMAAQATTDWSCEVNWQIITHRYRSIIRLHVSGAATVRASPTLGSLGDTSLVLQESTSKDLTVFDTSLRALGSFCH